MPAYAGRDHEGRRLTVWAHEWVNPRPTDEIASVQLCYCRHEPDERLVLLAMGALR